MKAILGRSRGVPLFARTMFRPRPAAFAMEKMKFRFLYLFLAPTTFQTHKMGFAACRGAARVSQCARHFIIKPSISLSRPGVFHRAFTQPALTIRNQRRLNSSVATDAPSEASRADITNAGTSPSETSSSQPSPAEISPAETSPAETSSSESFPQTPSETPPDISEIETLSPPWQFKHLRHAEQAAYYQFGPKYMTLHPDSQFRNRARESVKRRTAFANRAEEKLGSDWFAVVEAYDLHAHPVRDAAFAGWEARKAELDESVKFPEGMPKSEKNDLEQKRMAGHKVISKEIYEFHRQRNAKRWEDLKLLAEEMKNRRG